jgi:Ca-activated chloride channel family protein
VEKKISEELKNDTNFDFVDVPLADVVDYLEDRHGVPIELDTPALDEAGIDWNAPVTSRENATSLAAALESLLRNVNLTFVVDDVLIVTTPAAAEKHQMWVVFNQLVMRRSVRLAQAEKPKQPDFDALIAMISSTIAPDVWDEVGPPGSIEGSEGNLSLMVRQTRKGREEPAIAYPDPEVWRQLTERRTKYRSQGGTTVQLPNFSGRGARPSYDDADFLNMTLSGEVAGFEKSLSLIVRQSQSLNRKQTFRVYDAEEIDRVPILGPMRVEEGQEPRELAAEEYTPIHENAFLPVRGEQAVSTFSVDVDTASYSNMRRMLKAGALPHPDAVRIEELVNYFHYDYPQPKDDAPFSANMELADCPWNGKHRLLRVALKGREIEPAKRPAANLVFLLDVSGSMDQYNKLPLVQKAMKLLVGELRADDRVAIVVYAGSAGLVLDTTAGNEELKIRDAIDRLQAGGSTNGGEGIVLAYEKALANFKDGGVNRVILATDGDLNVGITDDDSLVELIKQKAANDVFLTVLGFGTGNLKDSKLEKLADNGNGNYAYIDNLMEARKVLIEQIGGSLVTIAKDVKLQLEFNPAEVRAYRLIGYENRLLAARDFDDDTKDAGEIGAGHTVTALYELVPAGSNEKIPDIDEATKGGPSLKYQQVEQKPAKEKGAAEVKLTDAAKNGDLLTLALRYKQPEGDVSTKREFTLPAESKAFNKASRDFQFAASVASFGMLLRNSKYAGDATFASVEEIAGAALGADKQGRRKEFTELVQLAEQLRGKK